MIVGSENSLVAIVDPANDQGDRISWISNLVYPTGTADILSGATTTTFDQDEVIQENPFIEFDDVDSVWKTTSSTPLYDHVSMIDLDTEDIQGQLRPLLSNPGADHYSMSSIHFAPLTAEDVGPFANNDSSTSLESVLPNNHVSVFPIPADDIVCIHHDPTTFKVMELMNSNGSIINSNRISKNTTASFINVSPLKSGMYFIKLTGGKGVVHISKIVVQH